VVDDLLCRETGEGERADGADRLVSLSLHYQTQLPFGLSFNYRTTQLSRNEPR